MKSELFSALPDVSFAEKDPDIITSELISAYENFSGRNLAPSDPVRVFFDTIILAIIQLRNCIDKAAKMNLLAYASGSYLDNIGALLGVTRLPATPAKCKIQFRLSETQNTNITIPAGTRITHDGSLFFATDNDLIIEKGQVFGLVDASCTETGTKGNNFLENQIKNLVDVFPYEMTALNYTATSGGTDTENDENFRERIQIAPETFSNAGSKSAYLFYTKSADSSISDAAILTPPDTQPGYVKIFPLLTGGEIPSDEIIQKVLNIVNSETIRPDTDYVSVEKPEIISYNIDLNFWVNSKNWDKHENIVSAVHEAVNLYVSWQKSALGRYITPSKLSAFVMNAGADRCTVLSPDFKKLEKFQVAHADNIKINFRGLD